MATTDDQSVEMVDSTSNTKLLNDNQDEEEKEQLKNVVVVDIDDDNKTDKKDDDDDINDKRFIDLVADVSFTKSLMHKKIEKDVYNVLDDNVGWRLKDEKYRTIRKIRKKYPDLNDSEMMKLCDVDNNDLYNAYNNISALNDDEIKTAIRLKSDIKLIEKRYPLPVFSSKTYNLTFNTDGFLFFELLFEFIFLPFYLFFQTFFMFCYLERGELPLSGTTDLLLSDHFKVDINKTKKKHELNKIMNKDESTETSDYYKLPRGHSVKNYICNRERPSHTSCGDVWCCGCGGRGVNIQQYIDAMNYYKKQKEKQKISLRIVQRQRIILTHNANDAAAAVVVNRAATVDIDQDLTDELKKIDSERKKLLKMRGKSCCDKTTCCCMCPTSWQMAPLLDVNKDDNKSRVNTIYFTPGWFNNCTPYDMLSWCFSTQKDVDYHNAELNLVGNISKNRKSFRKNLTLNHPRSILLFRLLICCLISILYCIMWFNGISCLFWIKSETNFTFFYDFSKSEGNTDCAIEGVLPIIFYSLSAIIIAFWAAFRSKIKVPNISKLDRFQIHWYNFTNVTNEKMIEETVKLTTFMNNQTGHVSEGKLLKEIENSTTSAKEFINLREDVFRERIRRRVNYSKLLRFRHDLDYALFVRCFISLIISLLPTIYKLCDVSLHKKGNILQFNIIYIITSFILNFVTSLLFFSFIHHQIFFTDQLDLFSFILNDITTIIQWPNTSDEDVNDSTIKKNEKRRKIKRKFGFNVARIDKFKTTTETADISDDIISSMDLNSLPYCNVLEHGNALAWVEMRSWLQGMIKALLSKVDMLLAWVVILLFLDACFIFYFGANHNTYNNQPVLINGIIIGVIIILYLGLFSLWPLLLHGPKLRKLQAKQISGLEKQKLIAANIVNNEKYFSQFRFRAGGLWDGKLKEFAPQLGIGFLQTSIQIVKDGDFSAEGILGAVSKNLFLKSLLAVSAAALPTVVTSIF